MSNSEMLAALQNAGLVTGDSEVNDAAVVDRYFADDIDYLNGMSTPEEVRVWLGEAEADDPAYQARLDVLSRSRWGWLFYAMSVLETAPKLTVTAQVMEMLTIEHLHTLTHRNEAYFQAELLRRLELRQGTAYVLSDGRRFVTDEGVAGIIETPVPFADNRVSIVPEPLGWLEVSTNTPQHVESCLREGVWCDATTYKAWRQLQSHSRGALYVGPLLWRHVRQNKAGTKLYFRRGAYKGPRDKSPYEGFSILIDPKLADHVKAVRHITELTGLYRRCDLPNLVIPADAFYLDAMLEQGPDGWRIAAAEPGAPATSGALTLYERDTCSYLDDIAVSHIDGAQVLWQRITSTYFTYMPDASFFELLVFVKEAGLLEIGRSFQFSYSNGRLTQG